MIVLQLFSNFEYSDREVISLDNINFDENTINRLKDMMNKGELNDVISQIPPEMIQNFSTIMNQQKQNTQNQNQSQNFNQNSSQNSNQNSNSTNQFDFSQIDMNTILKMKSIMEKLNNSNDPRTNLLYSLKPYLRDERKNKVDQYANLLNVAKIADILKNDYKESPHNG